MKRVRTWMRAWWGEDSKPILWRLQFGTNVPSGGGGVDPIASGQNRQGSILGSADAVTSVIRSRKKSLAAISISVRASRSHSAKNRRSYEHKELGVPRHFSILHRVYLRKS